MQYRTCGQRRGFTIIEVVALVTGLGAGAAVVGVLAAQPATEPKPALKPEDKPAKPSGVVGQNPSMLSALAKARASARQIKCEAQVRGMTQAMIVWASGNESKYPLPSDFDVGNQTVAELGRAKDTTANIYSLLIYNGSISSEICVCPDEHNKQIRPYTKYEYTAPKKAVVPAMGIWDPAFATDFTSGKGRTSYAHLQPSGDFVVSGNKDKKGKPMMEPTGRLSMWSDTFAMNEAVLGDRGPEIESVAAGQADEVMSSKAKTKLNTSITLKNHGAPGTWEGNVGYNDSHVEFLTTLNPSGAISGNKYTDADGKNRWDSIYFDESDDAKAANTYLGIFVKAGKSPKEFKGIWD